MKYQLHDYELDAVILEEDKIIFSFPNGFYAEDGEGHELKPLRRKLVFNIDRTGWTDASLESFLSIRRITRGMKGWKYISFQEFVSLFEEGNMVVHDEYHSKLTNWKMLQINASTNYGNIEMFITDIENIECLE